MASFVNICQLGVAPPGASAVAGWGADGAILRTAGWRSQRLRLRFQPGEVWLARWSLARSLRPRPSAAGCYVYLIVSSVVLWRGRRRRRRGRKMRSPEKTWTAYDMLMNNDSSSVVAPDSSRTIEIAQRQKSTKLKH